jgi:hypothetical protein
MRLLAAKIESASNYLLLSGLSIVLFAIQRRHSNWTALFVLSHLVSPGRIVRVGGAAQLGRLELMHLLSLWGDTAICLARHERSQLALASLLTQVGLVCISARSNGRSQEILARIQVML